MDFEIFSGTLGVDKNESPDPEDVGVPLRLHRGKKEIKAKKFMSKKEIEKKENQQVRRSKRVKVQNNKLDDLLVKLPKKK